MLRLANDVVTNRGHDLNKEYELLPSKCRFRVAQFDEIKVPINS